MRQSEYIIQQSTLADKSIMVLSYAQTSLGVFERSAFSLERYSPSVIVLGEGSLHIRTWCIRLRMGNLLCV